MWLVLHIILGADNTWKITIFILADDSFIFIDIFNGNLYPYKL